MGTRCIIGIADNLEQKKMRAVYCHYDGYPDGVGIELMRSYNTEEKILALLEKGGMESLGSTLENTRFYGDEPARDYSLHKPDGFTDIEFRYVYDRSSKTWYVENWERKMNNLQQAIDDYINKR